MGQQTTPSYIVYQCYGDEAIFHECAYSLLTLSQLYRPEELAHLQIWIYTDKPEWFRAFRHCPLPLHYRKLDDALIKQWKGEIDFVHRVKIELLRDLMQTRAGNILYLDTDTVFLHRIDNLLQAIESGRVYMHTMEGIVSNEGNPIMKKLSFYLRDQQTIKISGKVLHDTAMWNAGVIGFNTRYHVVLDEALFFTDMVHPQFPKHVVEQFAISLYFQVAANIHAASPWLLHYWNVKEFRSVLASFFSYFKTDSWDELTLHSRMVQLHVIMQEKVSFLSNRTVLDKLKKDTWEPVIPEWPLLLQQL
ncbi:MAG: hypothetical protein H0X33_03125 [Taibaiella sp.]|nr:hypothetical protein [Taibaiella sp.]